jgi:hypothetical protein
MIGLFLSSIAVVPHSFLQDPADMWMSDWLSELRYSLEASFEAIWQQFDSDGNGELDTHELDHLVAEMLKVSMDSNPRSGFRDYSSITLISVCFEFLRLKDFSNDLRASCLAFSYLRVLVRVYTCISHQAMDPESEPTKHQVKEVKGRIGVGGGGGGRGRNPRGVDKGTLRVGLLDYIEDEFRERLSRGEVGNGAVAAWADCAGLFAVVDTNGDGTVTHAEFQ